MSASAGCGCWARPNACTVSRASDWKLWNTWGATRIGPLARLKPASTYSSLSGSRGMTEINTFSGDFTLRGGRYALVAGRFNSFIVQHLIDGAVDTLTRHGVDAKDNNMIHTPGAFEIPQLEQKTAATKKNE